MRQIRMNPTHATQIGSGAFKAFGEGGLGGYLGHFGKPQFMARGHNSGGHWMAKAFANSHGQFKAKARKAGQSTRAFAEKEKGAAGKTGKQARLALAGMNARH